MLHDYSTRMITVIFSFFATLSWGWGSNIRCNHWKCQEAPRTKGSLAAHWHVLLLVVSFFNMFCFIYKHFFPVTMFDVSNIVLPNQYLVEFLYKNSDCSFMLLLNNFKKITSLMTYLSCKQVLRGMPNGEGPKLVEREDGIDAMERFQFHENEDLRNMANGLVDKYFGEDYGLDE